MKRSVRQQARELKLAAADRLPKKRARAEVDRRRQAADALLARGPEQIAEDIARIEREITDKAAAFERARMDMLMGAVSQEGIRAKQQTDSLMAQLDRLRTDLRAAHAREDAQAFERARDGMTDASDAPAAPADETGCCPGGCSPQNLQRGGDCVDVCMVCHATYDRRLDNEARNVSFSDNHPENVVRIGGYKPPNHFCEIVAQFQGKRRTTAPQHVVDKIEEMCVRHKIPKHKITPLVVRNFLKLMQQQQAMMRKFRRETVPDKAKKYTDYYKHCPEMAYRLSGIPPPYMTPMQENRVTALFPMVVRGYKTSPRYIAKRANKKNRKTRDEPNNMNYLYVFYKLCQLLNYNEFLPHIPLPKSVANIDDNDENGWKHVCGLYGWFYVPTCRS